MTTKINTDYTIEIPQSALDALGWKLGDVIEFDIPLTGGGINLKRKSDPTCHYKGVREVITARECNCPTARWSARLGDHETTCPSYVVVKS